MQSKGAIRFVAILLLLASLWQLSFTAISNKQVENAGKYAENAAKEYAAKEDGAFMALSAERQAEVLDSIRNKANRFYLDSISSEKVYFGYTLREVQEKSINLGLDLKGGMNVMLQVQMSDVVSGMAVNPCEEFNTAIELAKKNPMAKNNFVDAFAAEWANVNNGKRLSSVFKIDGDDATVIAAVKEKTEQAIDNSFQVLSRRIDRFGVTQPNIQKVAGGTGRILIELPGVKEPERVRKLLQGTASLEFWTTYEASEVFGYMQEANNLLREYLNNDVVEVKEEAAPASDDLLAQATQEDSLSIDEANYAKNNPLFYALQPSIYNGQVMPGPMVGVAHYKDTAAINKWLSLPQIKSLFPRDLKLMWTVKPSAQYANDSYFELIAIKASTRDGKAPLDGGAVADARMSYANTGGTPEVDMSMNAEGARIWARLTADNIGKCIAIALDGTIYSYPRVQTEISGGRSQITGNYYRG